MTDPARIQEILQERAVALARPEVDAARADDAVDLLVLRVGAERFGVDVHHAQEVFPLDGLTDVPGVADEWAGVINRRGVIHPVIAADRYLGTRSSPPAENPSVVLLRAPDEAIGLLVDAVLGLRSVPRRGIRELERGSSERSEALVGVTDDMLAVLDIQTILDDFQPTPEEEP